MPPGSPESEDYGVMPTSGASRAWMRGPGRDGVRHVDTHRPAESARAPSRRIFAALLALPAQHRGSGPIHRRRRGALCLRRTRCYLLGGGKPMSDVFWFKMPDDEHLLANMKPAQLRCYLVILRDVQRAKHRGRLSVRQIADRTGLSLKTAHAAVEDLIRQKAVRCEKKPGAIAVYTLPFSFSNRSPVGEQLKSGNCSPVGEQSEPEGERLGEQHCSPVGERNCSPGR
jgi:hypothetical protein